MSAAACETLWCTEALGSAACTDLRRRMVFECGKYDLQYGDVQVLADFALVLEAREWRRLAKWSQALAAESLAAERELAARPDLHAELGMPRRVRRAMRAGTRDAGAAAGPRYMRFDFHPTSDGWRISEVNSDVPGGFIEAAGLARLMSELTGAGDPSGDPGAALADAVARIAGAAGDVGLVHATAYADDRQVMVHLVRMLESRGIGAHLIAPEQVQWNRHGDDAAATMRTGWRTGPLDAIVRFFPGEWLANLPMRCGWPAYFGHGSFPLSNPATALLTQSKRFPLAWDRLETAMPTWRELLPETRCPRHADGGDGWVLKPALGRVGEGVAIRGVSASRMVSSARRWARLFPRAWAAQRRFDAQPVELRGKRYYPCIGVFVVNGVAVGAYGRLAERPLIDSHARDVAVLVAPERDGPPAHIDSPHRHARAIRRAPA